MNDTNCAVTKCERDFYENVTPAKLTEARRIQLNSECWGVLTEYYLESVKITRLRCGEVSSTAIIKVGDRSGQVACILRGASIGLLFGLCPVDWGQVEQLCATGQQLFYRYFKAGLSPNFGFNQKLFYNFCLSNQKSDVFVVKFKRCVNKRQKDAGDAFLNIIDIKKCDGWLMDLYTSQLHL